MKNDLSQASWPVCNNSQPVPVHIALAERALMNPSAPAVHYGLGMVTYAELQAKVDSISAGLRAFGVRPESVVAISIARSVDQLACLYAILAVGAAFMPLAPELPIERRAAMISDCGAQWVLMDDASKAELNGAQALDIRSLLSQQDWQHQAMTAAYGQADISSNALAYVLFTSGSTGRPKGVAVQHQALALRLLGMQQCMPLIQADRFLQRTPLSFDVAVEEIFWPLSCGASVVLADPSMDLDAKGLLSLMAAQHVTVADFVPALLERLVAAPELLDCTALRRVLCGGEAMPASLMHSFFQRLPDVELFNVYGPTEAVINAMVWQASRLHADAPPIGRALPHTHAVLLDEHGAWVPEGVIGELYLGGVLAQGYVGQDQLTDERFFSDPENIGQRLYRTGDLACRLPDGNFAFHGRTDHQVKLRGARIELGEVEVALMQHSAVRQACVVVHGNGTHARLVAYMATKCDQSAAQWRTHLRGILPAYMVPSTFVSLDSLPLTATGKVDRGALRAHTLASAKQSARSQDGQAASGRESVLDIVKGAFCRVLKLGEVSDDEDFFDLGGDSLQATELLAELDQLSGMELTLQTLYEAPSALRLAELISAHAPGGSIFNLAREFSTPMPGFGISSTPNVVMIKKGDPDHSLFCLHPGDGGSSLYLPMVRSMVSRPTVYALTAWDLRHRLWPSGTVQDFASDYVRQILLTRPSGPYNLMGWSSGAVLAFEIAQQLEAMGEQLGLVALVDPFEPWDAGRGQVPRPTFLPEEPFTEGDWDLALRMLVLNECLRPASDPFWTLPEPKQFEWVCATAKDAGRFPPNMDAHTLAYICRVVRLHCHAYDYYCASRGHFDFTLFVRKIRPANDTNTTFWPGLSSGVCRIVETDGDHLSMMRIPHVGRIAQVLDTSFRRG